LRCSLDYYPFLALMNCYSVILNYLCFASSSLDRTLNVTLGFTRNWDSIVLENMNLEGEIMKPGIVRPIK